MMRHLFAIVVLAAALAQLAGCGQTGPLYLPGDSPPEPQEEAQEEQPQPDEPQYESIAP